MCGVLPPVNPPPPPHLQQALGQGVLRWQWVDTSPSYHPF